MAILFSELVFKENAIRYDIYSQTGPWFKGFTFVCLSQPKVKFPTRQRAGAVLGSRDQGQKPLFKDLIPLGEGHYYRDRKESLKRLLKVIKLNHDEVRMYLLNFYSRNVRKVLTGFIRQKALGNHPPEPKSPTDLATGTANDTKIQL